MVIKNIDLKCGMCKMPAPILCEGCGKQITDKQFFCLDTSGGADDPEHYHKNCRPIEKLARWKR